LPSGFYFDDERWAKIWQRLKEEGEALSHEDLCTLIPEQPVLTPRTAWQPAVT
jgi:hypothetical protein